MPTIIKGIIFPKRRAISAKVAPKEREPTSPNIIREGYTLKYRKEMRAPIQRERKRDIGVSKEVPAKIQKAKRAINKIPQDRPSSPSVILKKLAKATIMVVLMGIKKRPRVIAPKKGR